MQEISIKNLTQQLEIIQLQEKISGNHSDIAVKFFSPTKDELSFYQLSDESPDMYVIINFVNLDKRTDTIITLNQLIDKLKNLGAEYQDTYIDFIDQRIDNDSMDLGPVSFENNEVLIQFIEWSGRK